MKRILVLTLLTVVLLSGCGLPGAEQSQTSSEAVSGTDGTGLGEKIPSLEQELDAARDVMLSLGVPDIDSVGVEAFIACFKDSPDYAVLEDYTDPRDYYSASLEVIKNKRSITYDFLRTVAFIW